MRFDVKMILEIDEEDNLLPVSEEMYEEVLAETLQDLIYDVDGATILKIEVKRR